MTDNMATDIGETLFFAVDDYLYDDFLKGYPENHCNPEKLPALREVFLSMSSTPPDVTLLERAEAEAANAKTNLAINAKMLAHQCNLAREAALIHALEIVWEERFTSASYEDVTRGNVTGWSFYLDERKSKIVRDALQDISPDATALLERLAGLEDEVTSLRASIEEVAIPSLLYCEKMYDHDSMARLNLEAALQLRERVERSG